MKKLSILIFSALLTLVLFLAVACGNVPSDNSTPAESETTPSEATTPSESELPLLPLHRADAKGIDQAVASALKYDFYDLRNYEFGKYGETYHGTLDDIFVFIYYGNFDGCEVVCMGDNVGYNQAVRMIDVAGYKIIVPSYMPVYVYRDHSFYRIKEAYDAGLLTKSSIYELGCLIDLDFESKYDPSTVNEDDEIKDGQFVSVSDGLGGKTPVYTANYAIVKEGFHPERSILQREGFAGALPLIKNQIPFIALTDTSKIEMRFPSDAVVSEKPILYGVYDCDGKLLLETEDFAEVCQTACGENEGKYVYFCVTCTYPDRKHIYACFFSYCS